MPQPYDAVVVGSGPNGLAAAIALCKAGIPTLVLEAKDTPGGGSRTEELTLPGFAHDVCSTVHPLGAASPFFAGLGLDRHGLRWVHPAAPLAHVFDADTVYTLERSVAHTAAQFGRDAGAYTDLMGPFVDAFERLVPMILSPLRFPESPWLMARFGLEALRSMRGTARNWFVEAGAPALMASIAAHGMLPLHKLVTSSFGLVLASAGHAVGWPIALGGSRAITDALVSCLRAHGGELELGREVTDIAQLPRAKAYLFDLTPRALLRIAGSRLPAAYRRRIARYRHGPGVYKVDWALSGPIPWRHPACARAATVHLSGSFSDIARTEAAVHAGTAPDVPFVLLVQPTLFDATRAPHGGHVAWAYCHVPHGSDTHHLQAIEAHVERYAPGFRDLVLARSVRTAAELERYNPNYVGGDIAGGVCDIRQLLFRPIVSTDPYATGAPDVFLCSSSTPPGGGVHGMCGYWAAQSALTRVFKRSSRPRSVRPPPVAQDAQAMGGHAP